jgi:glycerol uptake facilitator-like aquaporin
MTPEGKRMAKYAAVGAIIAIPVPIVGPIIGGIVGAVIAHKKNERLARGSY